MDCKEDINELLARYFAKEELTGAQQQVLDEWISANRKEFERMQRVVEAPVKKPEPAEFNAEAAWEKVESRKTKGRLSSQFLVHIQLRTCIPCRISRHEPIRFLTGFK